MARELKQSDFDALLPKDVDVRPVIARQVRRFLASSDYSGELDSDIAKAEEFLRLVERKRYAKKLRKGSISPNSTSAPYEAMLKNWGRKDPDTGLPRPKGDHNFARGVLYYFFRNVGNHVYFTEIAKHLWEPRDIIFRRLYYAKYHDNVKEPNFSAVCARYHAEDRVVRREFDKLWIGSPATPPSKLHLGPVTIVFGEEDGLNRLSLQEAANQNYMTDGMPDVFKALDWRSRLSGFYGRDKEAACLANWAQDGSLKLKVILLSGPGGAGKTRLAADTVARLVHELGWRGGFLGDATRPIDGDGDGVVLIIDYPEERTDLVAKILKAAALSLKNGESYDRPVRIILISRETRETWGNILNEPASFIDEIRLDARPYLEIDDALAIAEDIAIEYPARLGRVACKFLGVENWLERAPHRLPLLIVAASVHAVLEPDHAFKLDSATVLTALADIELRRVRYYSERDLRDRESLEKLLSLSLFTNYGLSKETILELGEQNICFGKSGNNLLEAVRRTPYWCPKTAEHDSHLVRLEPDRPAAVFCLKALRLDDAPPSLPSWLIPAATQDDYDFGDRLSRLAFDIGHVNSYASQNLEQQSIAMLRLQPSLIHKFSSIAYRDSSTFSAAFSEEICHRLLDIALSNQARAPLLNNQGVLLSKIGKLEAALKASTTAVMLNRQLVLEQPDTFLPDLASSLLNLSSRLSENEQFGRALKSIEEGVSIYRTLVRNDPIFLYQLSSSLYNLGAIFAKIGQLDAALKVTEESVAIRRSLAETSPDTFLSELAMSLNNQADILNRLQQTDDAVKTVDEAVTIYRPLVQVHPELFSANLATALNNKAVWLNNIGQHKAALEAIDEAIAVRQVLARARPSAFLPDLAMSLINKSDILFEFKEAEASLEAAVEGVVISRKLVEDQPEVFRSLLVGALNNQAIALRGLNRLELSLRVIDEAVDLCRELVHDQQDVFVTDLARLLNTKAMTFRDAGENEAALNVIREVCAIYRGLICGNNEMYCQDLAGSLFNQSLILMDLRRMEDAHFWSLRAITTIKDAFLGDPMRYRSQMQMICYLHLDLCEKISKRPIIRLLDPVMSVLMHAPR